MQRNSGHEEEQRKLEEKAYFLCITVSFLRSYSKVTPIPLSLFSLFNFLLLAVFSGSLSLHPLLLMRSNLKVSQLLLLLLTQSDPVY